MKYYEICVAYNNGEKPLREVWQLTDIHLHGPVIHDSEKNGFHIEASDAVLPIADIPDLEKLFEITRSADLDKLEAVIALLPQVEDAPAMRIEHLWEIYEHTVWYPWTPEAFAEELLTEAVDYMDRGIRKCLLNNLDSECFITDYLEADNWTKTDEGYAVYYA